MRRDIEFFLKEKFNSGMLILGDWGIGKTYTIKKVTNEILGETGDYKYISYVPMNGMTDIKQLEESIYKNKRNVGESLEATITNLLKERLDVKKYFELYKLYLTNDISNTLIIVDDIERSFMNHDQDEAIELHYFFLVLGLLNRITQENNSKFIIIMNDDKIPKITDVINQSSEKYISTIVNFKQNSNLSDIVIGMLEKTERNKKISQSNKKKLNHALEYINSTNIRVIYKTLRSYLNILRLNLSDELEKDNLNQDINELIEDYYLFLCILNSLPMLNKNIEIDNGFIYKANSILNSHIQGKITDIALKKICDKISGNKIYKNDNGLLTPRLVKLIHARDHELAKLKNIIKNDILEIIKKLSNKEIIKLIKKIKTSLSVVTDDDLLCIKNDSEISVEDLLALIYYIDDEEKISILTKKFDQAVTNSITSHDKDKLGYLKARIEKSPLLKEQKKEPIPDLNINEKKIKLIEAKEKICYEINAIIEKENIDKKNKENTPLTKDETIDFFKKIILLLNNHIERIHKYDSDNDIALKLSIDSSPIYLLDLKNKFSKIKNHDSLTKSCKDNSEIIFRLIRGMENHNLDIKNNKFNYSTEGLDLDEIQTEINDFLNSVFTYIGEVKSNLWAKNPNLEKSMNLYVTEWYPE